jgi:hypothetical protein
MLSQIKVYFLVLSLIFLLKFIFQFVSKLRDENPKAMEVSKTEVIFIYLSLAYIITFIIT